MASIEEMSVDELKEFISIFPDKSACDRAHKEKLQEVLETKKLIQQQSLGEGNAS